MCIYPACVVSVYIEIFGCYCYCRCRSAKEESVILSTCLEEKKKSLLFGLRLLQCLVDCAKDLSCILKLRVEIIICFGTFNIVYVHHFGSSTLLWFRVFVFEIYVCVSLVAYTYTHKMYVVCVRLPISLRLYFVYLYPSYI